jgi:hypothetical protein
MIRALYRCVVSLHPPRFRRRFGEQMMCIFDEASSSGAWPLFADALVSLARQWVIRSRLWMLLVAVTGALLTLGAGVAVVPHARLAATLATIPAREFVVLAASVCLAMISFTLLLCVYWFRFSRRRRA